MQSPQLQLILDIAKENKMRLYKNLYKFYGDISLLDRRWDTSADRFFEYLWNQYIDDPQYARKIKVVYLAMEPILKKAEKTNYKGIGWYAFAPDRSAIADSCEVLYKKYWERFTRKFLFKWVKRDGGFPEIGKTEALKEFLAMGYVYKTEFTRDLTKYQVYSHIGGLWWPENFDSHMAAIAIQTKYGLGGLTGTTLPKNK